MNANKFLIKNPIITEKSSRLAELGKYVFLVQDKATKNEVKKAVENIYKVKVVGVQTINTRPKPRRFGRFVGMRSGYRKAIVTLKEGQKIEIMPQ
jgi:large subunit ribosomal protein L23